MGLLFDVFSNIVKNTEVDVFFFKKGGGFRAAKKVVVSNGK